MTISRPHSTNVLISRLGSSLLAILILFSGATLVVSAAGAQTSGSGSTPSSGSAPDLGNTVQGQSAGTPESAMRTVVNYMGNVICPIIAVIFVIMAVINWRTGKNFAGPLITAVALFMISGIVRYFESTVS